MVKVTCDRCGRQIGTTFPWMNPEYPILTITSQERVEEKPRMIDLCQVCKVKFYDWLDNEDKIIHAVKEPHDSNIEKEN